MRQGSPLPQESLLHAEPWDPRQGWAGGGVWGLSRGRLCWAAVQGVRGEPQGGGQPKP